MFGYVLANERQLTQEEHRRLRAFYCGLCRALKARHGLRGQLTLSFDMSFLTVLLSSLYEPETVERAARCALHPRQRHPLFENDAIAYGADMDVALFRYKCLDGWQDDKSLPALGMDRLLLCAWNRVEALYPRQCAAIAEGTARLTVLEKQKSDDLDALCACTGDMLAEVFVWREDRWSDTLRAMARALGAFIYLMDACEDMDRDRKRGAFNPLLERREQAEFDEWLRQTLTMLAAESARAFESLPLLQDAGLLRNILYSGIWTKYERDRQKKQKAGKEKPDGQ